MNPDVRREGESMLRYHARLRMQGRVRQWMERRRPVIRPAVATADAWPGFELKALARAVSDAYPFEAVSL